jgi:hypothetical protein
MYSKVIEDPQAERDHERALAQHDRAWHDMHGVGIEHGHDSVEFAEARRHVVILREEITNARKRAQAKRRWTA